MKSNEGYKGMLRNRVPRTVDLALKWCKAKDKWINHVYYTQIWFLTEKDARNYQTRCILGLAKGCRSFNFEKTIEWDSLTKEEQKYWQNVINWVTWFEESLLSIVDTYKQQLKKGESSEEIKTYVCNLYFNKLEPEWQDKLYKHIVNHIIQYYVLCIFPITN